MPVLAPRSVLVLKKLGDEQRGAFLRVLRYLGGEEARLPVRHITPLCTQTLHMARPASCQGNAFHDRSMPAAGLQEDPRASRLLSLLQ